MVEWDKDFSSDEYEKMAANAAEGLPQGCLSRIVGTGSSGPKVIEVWETAGDAQQFAEQTSAAVSEMNVPPPDRVSAFETSAYVVA